MQIRVIRNIYFQTILFAFAGRLFAFNKIRHQNQNPSPLVSCFSHREKRPFFWHSSFTLAWRNLCSFVDRLCSFAKALRSLRKIYARSAASYARSTKFDNIETQKSVRRKALLSSHASFICRKGTRCQSVFPIRPTAFPPPPDQALKGGAARAQGSLCGCLCRLARCIRRRSNAAWWPHRL